MVYIMNDTIVALATPMGKAGVAIVRMSGDDAISIAKKITTLSDTPRMMRLSNIEIDGLMDKALVVFFASPKSYTGEDMVEIQCHGGMMIAMGIINQCIMHGARMANAGEYSMRAYLNGKMSIDQAEGIADIINAESKAELIASSHIVSGRLASIVSDVADRLLNISADINADIDYPEYELSSDREDIIKAKLVEISEDLRQISGTYDDGRKIVNGVMVALIGAPNAGKSSLINAMVGEDIAIVTDVAGTTRDIISGEYIYDGVKYIVYDTAGIRETSDIVERSGVDRALAKVSDADIVVNILTIEDAYVYEGADITVYNKSDIYEYGSEVLSISATHNENIDELKSKIHSIVFKKEIKKDTLYITNARHYDAINSAIGHIDKALAHIGNDSIDMICICIDSAYRDISLLTGMSASQSVIDRIFSKFCIGK